MGDSFVAMKIRVIIVWAVTPCSYVLKLEAQRSSENLVSYHVTAAEHTLNIKGRLTWGVLADIRFRIFSFSAPI
jgi:hypothetical protein